MPSASGHTFIFLLIATIIATALRLDFLIADNFVVDADEAIVGLMAKHINEGAPLPVFYYGQHYMGSLEAIVAAWLFKIFGISSFSLKLAPLLFAIALVPLIYYLTLECAGIFAARIAALLMAVPPAAFVVWSTKARGGFVEVIFIGGLALLLAIRQAKCKDLSLLKTVLIGGLIGVGWWVNNQIIYFALTIALLVLVRFRFCNRAEIACHSVVASLSFLFGSAPFWIYNLEHDFASFGIFKSSEAADVFTHLSGLFSEALPILFGSKRFWQYQDYFLLSTPIMYLLYGGLALFIFHFRKAEIKKLLRFQIDPARPIELFLLFIIATCGVFVFSSFGYLSQAPRYLLPIYLGTFVLSGVTLEEVTKRVRFVGYVFILLLFTLNLLSSYLHGRAIPGEPFVFDGERVSKDHVELIAWLKDHNYSFIRTNYWIGYRLAFETEERIKFSIFKEPEHVRIPSYETAIADLPFEEVPIIVVPAQAPILKTAFKALGIRYDLHEKGLSGYQAFLNVRPLHQNLTTLPMHAVRLSASDGQTQLHNLMDNDLLTRWGSARPQAAGMTLTIDLLKAQKLKGLSFDLGDWVHDYPRGLSIKLELADGTVRELFDPKEYAAVRYFIGSNSEYRFLFETLDIRRVIFTQLGEDPIFDWSIAEIKLWS